jgi:copper resistance protein C
MGRQRPQRQNTSLSGRNQVGARALKQRLSNLWLLILATFVVAGVGFAHANLNNASIQDGQTVRVMPKSIRLEFSEALELGFSRFKLMALDAKIPDRKTANAAASVLVDRVFGLQNDQASRADTGLLTKTPIAAQIELGLKPNLPAGWYVMMWKVLSIDTHSSDDFFVFEFRP